jgi:hypothetical protein
MQGLGQAFQILQSHASDAVTRGVNIRYEKERNRKANR